MYIYNIYITQALIEKYKFYKIYLWYHYRIFYASPVLSVGHINCKSRKYWSTRSRINKDNFFCTGLLKFHVSSTYCATHSLFLEHYLKLCYRSCYLCFSKTKSEVCGEIKFPLISLQALSAKHNFYLVPLKSITT